MTAYGAQVYKKGELVKEHLVTVSYTHLMSIEIFRKLAVILKTDAGTLLGECKEEENHRLYDLICRAKKLKRKEQKILEKTMEVLIEGFGTEL